MFFLYDTCFTCSQIKLTVFSVFGYLHVNTSWCEINSGNSMATLHFGGFGPTLNAIIYISLIIFFTVVALYLDLTGHKIRISEMYVTI